MPQLEDSIVLILSSNPKNTAFGTGFIIARDQSYSYVLTCAHVLEQIKSKNSAEDTLKIAGFLDKSLEFVACGSGDEIDIAVLKVPVLFDAPLFEECIIGNSSNEILISGYSSFEGKNQAQRNLVGTLGESIRINNAQGINVSAWDINIKLTDGFSKLAPGYSGSPVYNNKGKIIGIVSHMRGAEAGHAVCISNVLRLYPDIIDIQPSFKRLTANSRLSQIRTKLLGRMADIAKIYLKLGKRLNQIEKEGIDDEAEIILQMCESFLNKEIDAATFSVFCLSLETEANPINVHPNYRLLAESLKNGHVCLCLGTELPKLFDLKLNSAQEFMQKIVALTGFEHENTSELAAVCEYAQLRSNDAPRHRVIEELRQLVTPNYQPEIELYELLSKLKKPFLVIATGFDTLLEQRLSNSAHSFISIVINKDTNIEDQRYLLKGFNTKQNEIPSCCSGDKLSSLQLMEKGFSLIFYLRGYPDELDNLLLSERDYFNQAKELLQKSYPSYLGTKLKSKDLWFLGYQPDSWETRLIAKVLQQQRGGDNNSSKPLVIQANPNSFEQLFWEDMKCTHYPNLSVTEFVAKIGELL